MFFHTALLDYELYRRYFPVWALALYETRRKARLPFDEREVSKCPSGDFMSRMNRLSGAPS